MLWAWGIQKQPPIFNKPWADEWTVLPFQADWCWQTIDHLWGSSTLFHQHLSQSVPQLLPSLCLSQNHSLTPLCDFVIFFFFWWTDVSWIRNAFPPFFEITIFFYALYVNGRLSALLCCCVESCRANLRQSFLSEWFTNEFGRLESDNTLCAGDGRAAGIKNK